MICIAQFSLEQNGKKLLQPTNQPVFISGDYGIPRSWNFPLQRSYWFGKSEEATTANGELCGKLMFRNILSH